MTVRARFAPSPTGYLHVGGARTALFNWLFARHHGGTLVLRIEDTDLERSEEHLVTGLQQALTWLGIDWDEGPVRQSERAGRHLEAVEQLRAGGHAYECFCTPEDIEARNTAANPDVTARTVGYDGYCRDLTDTKRAGLAAEGKPRSIRFRTPDDGTSRFVDLVRGEVAVDWENIGDFVIVRSSGAPVFFLANAVDDADMGITHVIRGEDLLDTTHRVLALRVALEIEEPLTFAHLPLILGPNGHKLSKRDGAVSLEDFADNGYLPEALLNYLALLGSPPVRNEAGEEQEVATPDELAAAFDIGRVNQSPAMFDYTKLLWMNGDYIRRLTPEEFAARALRFGQERYAGRLDEAIFAAAMALAQPRATTLAEAAEAARFLFTSEEEFRIAEESLTRLRETERAAEILDAVIAHLEACDWTPEAVDLRPVLDGLGIKPRKALPAVYAAVEGTHAGLPLFDSIVLLGRERALGRLRKAQTVLNPASSR